MTEMIRRNDVMYWARIIPSSNIYDVYEVTIRTVKPEYIVGIEKHNKQAYLFSMKDIDNILFKDRGMALEMVKEAELRYKDDENN